MPAGLDVTIGARAASASPPAPGSSLGNAVDGDGTSAWCSRTLGPQSVTVDLGKATDITGTRLTFSRPTGRRPGVLHRGHRPGPR
jgi:hypothetical protein